MKKILGNIIGVAVKRLTIIAVLLALIAGSFITIPVNANDDNPTGSKISSALSMHVQMKMHQISEAGSMLPDEVTLPGMDIQSLENPVELAYEKVFLSFTQQPSQTQISELEALGITVYPDSWIPPVGNHATGFVLAKMPVGALNALAAKDFIIQMDTAEQEFNPQNDAARTATGVNDVWSSSNTGAGVTVAVLDSGIDTSNPDFPALNTSSSKDYSSYPTLDDTIANTATGHGTHVTGSVLGRGVNSATYKGMAPGADLVFLKIGNDTTGGASSDALVYAIRAAADTYHADIISLSYGGWSTYHDGSDAICHAVDYAVSQGVTVFVSAGNEADSGWHYSGTVSAGGTTDYIQINVSSGSSYLYTGMVWYDGPGTHNMLTLQYYNSSHSLLSPAISGQSESDRGTETNQYQMGSPLPTGTYYFKVRNFSSVSQSFHIYYYGGAYSVTFSNSDQYYTIGSPAEADGAIAVGAFVDRGAWYNYKGSWIGSGQAEGTIASFSARGPRVDTEAPQKPEIVAPGSSIISVRDSLYTLGNPSYDPRIVDNDGLNLNGSGPANYFVMQGTSMACPVAAGIGALLLSNNPELTPAQLKEAIESTASRSGVGPDNNWGWGLIDAAHAINVNRILNSYSDIAHTIPCVDFNRYSTQHTVYMFSTSFNGKTYKVTYYDGLNNKVATNLVTAGAYSFSDQHSFSSETDTAGTWHVIVTETHITPPDTYVSNYPHTITTAIFSVQNSAIYSGYPEVTTNGANNINTTSVTLNATLNSLGTAESVSVSFEYGLTTAYGTIIVGDPTTMTEQGTFSANITSLTLGQTYHFRARADGGASGFTFDSDKTFSTWATPLVGKIAFSSSRDGNFEIYIMDADGSNQTRLTNWPGDEFLPAISPDGSKIAFVSGEDICTINIDGSNRTSLTTDTTDWCNSPSWSPDGNKIAYTCGPQVWIMDYDGSDKEQLTSGSSSYDPSWSPDGTKIAFISGGEFYSQLFIMNADGTNKVKITNDTYHCKSPAWAPDGLYIAYVRQGGGILTIKPNGADEIEVTSFTSGDPCWSPDSTKIAYTYSFQIHLMNTDGSNDIVLTNIGNINKQPSWSVEYVVPAGLLRVQTVPPVPTTIFIDGIPRDGWGLNWVKLSPGSYMLSFSDVPGVITPTEVSIIQNGGPPTTHSLSSPITIVQGQVTEVIANFAVMGNLHVVTSPPVQATIFCDGHPMDDWGFWSYLAPGDYTISFEPLDGFITPEPIVATVDTGTTTTITGVYDEGSNTVTPTPHGYLRVQTSPPVPTTILIDGIPRDGWGLNWVKLPPGSYTLSFSDVPGVITPISVTISQNGEPATTHSLSSPIIIVDGQITEMIANFAIMGNLHVVTSPPAPATVFVNGNPMDDWGFWTYIEPGEYIVSFQPLPDMNTPPPLTVTVSAGATTHVVGDYNTGQSYVVP